MSLVNGSENLIITKYGYLLITRAGKDVNVLCPFFQAEIFQQFSQGVEYKVINHHQCGDWCVLFGEPNKSYEGLDKCVRLALCKKVYKVDIKNFRDERPQQKQGDA